MTPEPNPAPWNHIEASRKIMLKWKIEKTLDNFFSLLDYVSKTDVDVRRMWPDRKRFIQTCYDEGYVSDAWFVLGKMAYKNSDKFLSGDPNSYGRITKGANPKHSVLLFKIGNLILSEWSYNGKIRGWRNGSETAPEFYKKEYIAGELRFAEINPGKGQTISLVHRPNAWIAKLCQEIYSKTNGQVDLRDKF